AALWRGAIAVAQRKTWAEPLGAALVEEVPAQAAARGLRRIGRAVAALTSRRRSVDVAPSGWDVVGVGSYDDSAPLPASMAAEISEDNPSLNELRARYDAFDSPLTQRTWWAEDYRRTDLDLRWFRGDNAFVWQYRHVPEHTTLRYALYRRYLEDRDDD